MRTWVVLERGRARRVCRLLGWRVPEGGRVDDVRRVRRGRLLCGRRELRDAVPHWDVVERHPRRKHRRLHRLPRRGFLRARCRASDAVPSRYARRRSDEPVQRFLRGDLPHRRDHGRRPSAARELDWNGERQRVRVPSRLLPQNVDGRVHALPRRGGLPGVRRHARATAASARLVASRTDLCGHPRV